MEKEIDRKKDGGECEIGRKRREKGTGLQIIKIERKKTSFTLRIR